MTDPLLPPGIRVGACTTLDERQAVLFSIELKDGAQLALVLSSAETRALVVPLQEQVDRQVRALAALLLRQAQLVDEANWRGGGLRIAGGSEA